MRWHGRRVTVYAYGRPTDMRNGFDGLSALVTQDLARDPLSGEVFIFVIALTISELNLFLDGSALVEKIALSPPAITHFSLASDPTQ
jgi:hypothetical protein